MVDLSAARTAVREEMLRLAVRCRKVHSAVVQVVLVAPVRQPSAGLVAPEVAVARPTLTRLPTAMWRPAATVVTAAMEATQPLATAAMVALAASRWG